MIRRSFIKLMAGVVPLSACGFKLRGHENYAFKRLIIVGARASGAARLQRLIESGSDTQIVQAFEDADAILHISEFRNQAVLTFTARGIAQEYQLNYSLRFMLTAGDGALLIPASEITIHRDMMYNTKYQNSKAQETDILYEDMQNDAIDQLVRRLSAVRPLHLAPN